MPSFFSIFRSFSIGIFVMGAWCGYAQSSKPASGQSQTAKMISLDTSFTKKPITYIQFLGLVGKNNLGYISEQFNLGVVEAGIEMARVFPDPTISYGAFNVGQERLKMGYGFNSALGATIELGGKRKARVNLAQSRTELTNILLQNYFRNLRADATNSFLLSIKQENILQVKINSYTSMNRLALSDSIRLKLGSIMEIDSRQTTLEARSKLNEVYQSEADWKAAMLQLGMLLGHQMVDTLYYAKGDYITKFDREYVLSDLISTAQNQRADLMAALRSKEVSEKELELAKANRVIDLGLSLGVSSTSVVTNYVAPTPSFSNIYGGISIPLRFSNKYTGDLRAAEYAIRQSEVLYNQVELQIKTEVTQSYFNYMALRKQIQQFNTGLLDEAKRVFDGKVYSYQRGKTSLLEVLVAQRTYNEVRQSYYETLFNYSVSLVELERAAGIWDIDF